mmetsp:Transcript_49590/g.130749  ORF Transcript_49590/g.130749 Transcript_49590/m.130749 type:complete len:205 (-) Transcript_49590:318-932(-)
MAVVRWLESLGLLCCYADDNQEKETSVNWNVAHPHTEERTAGALLVNQVAGANPDSGEMSSDEKQREKEKFYRLVREFAKATTRSTGEPCGLFLAPGDTLVDGSYSIDKTLKVFSAKPAKGQAHVFDLQQIQNISRDPAEAGHPAGVERVARDNLAERYVGVTYLDASGATQSIGLVLATPYERERFFVCVKILRWAMESGSSP